jgi:hypothetical protein
MHKESHRQDPEEFYVKQDRIGSPLFILLDFTKCSTIYATGIGAFGEVYKG